MRFYIDGNDNYGRPRWEYLVKIASMDDQAIETEAEKVVWLSAFANNNPMSDFHWQADAIYDECADRQKPEIYKRGFQRAKTSAGC